jgi:hypothetical protein
MTEIEAIAGWHDVPVGACMRDWVLTALASSELTSSPTLSSSSSATLSACAGSPPTSVHEQQRPYAEPSTNLQSTDQP